jgi:hypothetical protein
MVLRVATPNEAGIYVLRSTALTPSKLGGGHPAPHLTSSFRSDLQLCLWRWLRLLRCPTRTQL